MKKFLLLMFALCLIVLTACGKAESTPTTPDNDIETTSTMPETTDYHDIVYLGFPDTWIPIPVYDNYQESIQNPYSLDVSTDHVLFFYNYPLAFAQTELYTLDKQLHTSFIDVTNVDYEYKLDRIIIPDIENYHHYTIILCDYSSGVRYITFNPE